MQQMHSFKGIYYLIQNIGLLETKIVYRDQCITYFKWLKFHVLRSKHDEKKNIRQLCKCISNTKQPFRISMQNMYPNAFFFVDDSITFVQCNFLILKIIMKWFIKSLHTYKFFTDHMKLLFGRLVGFFFSISLTFIYSIQLIPFVLSYVQSGLLNIMFGKERLAGDLISVINLNDVLVMHELYLWLSHPRSQRR